MGMEFNAPRRILTGEGCLADAEKYFCSMGKKAFSDKDWSLCQCRQVRF